VAAELQALLAANARYWTTVAALVRGELAHWRNRASAIADPELRRLALGKLEDERFNAQAGAMLATRAPRAHRADVVRAIVALQVLFDLLDGLTERPAPDPLADGERAFTVLFDALTPHLDRNGEDEVGYLRELSDAVRAAVARLPAYEAVLDVAAASGWRAAQAQVRMHALAQLGVGQLQAWAEQEAHGTGLQWRELLAGAASSVLVVHALIAAAADTHTTPAQAVRIAEAYLSICVLLTLLDSLVDQEHDEHAGQPGFVSLYENHEMLGRVLTDTARRARAQALALPAGVQHVMMLSGVVAYYSSMPDARAERARPLIAQLHRELGPSIAPALAFMKAWRLAKRLRARVG